MQSTCYSFQVRSIRRKTAIPSISLRYIYVGSLSLSFSCIIIFLAKILKVVNFRISLIRVVSECSMEAIRMLSPQRNIPIITLILAQIIWKKPWTGKC